MSPRAVVRIAAASIAAAGLLFAAPAQAQTTGAQGAKDRSALPGAARPCAVCHGNDGIADLTGVPNLAGQRADYLVKQTAQMRAAAEARLGRQPTAPLVPPSAPSHRAYYSEHRDNQVMDRLVASLDDDTIQAVAEFFAALPRACPPPQSRGAPPKVLARCAVCHGKDGVGPVARIPTLAGQHALYLADQIRRMRAAQRGEVFIGADIAHMSGVMGTQAISLDEDQIGALAAWFATAPCEPGR